MFKDKEKLNRRAEYFITIVSALLVLVTVAGTLTAALFCVNQSDDYSHAMEIGVFNEGFFSYLKTSFFYMVSMYKGWAGNYTSMFLQGWLSPLNNGGLPQLRAVMFVNGMLFFASTLIFLYRFLGLMFSGRVHIKMALIALFMFAFMNYRCYYEIFYWFSGATSYSFPMSILYISLILYITGRKNKVMYIASLICAFLAAGGSLTLAGVGCFVSFLYCVYCRIADGKFSKDSICLFATTLAGSLINVAAPGNYVRSGSYGTNVSFAGAVKNTVSSAYGEYRWLFHDTNFIIVIMIVLVIGMILSEEIKYNPGGYYTVTVLGLAAPLVSIFPVVMGYGMDFLANRTLFIIDQTLYLSLMNAALCLGIVLRKIMGKEFINQTVFTFAVAAAVYACVSNFSLRDLQSVRTIACDMNGTFSTYYDECLELEEYFRTCSGKDLTVDAKEVPAGPDNFSCFYLENSWVNEAIAAYYGMNSLTVTDDL